MLPTDRLLRAGADQAEVDVLQARYDSMTPAAQGSMDLYFAGISEGDIRDWLALQEENGVFDDAEIPAEGAEPEAPNPPVQLVGSGTAGPPKPPTGAEGNEGK